LTALVLIPGTMGTASYVLVGTKESMRAALVHHAIERVGGCHACKQKNSSR